MLFRILNTFIDMIQRRPDIQTRCVRVAQKFEGLPSDRPFGPVGVARFAASEAGAAFAGDLSQIRQSIGKQTHIISLHSDTAKRTRSHQIRDILRRKRWADMAATRPSLNGIEAQTGHMRRDSIRTPCCLKEMLQTRPSHGGNPGRCPRSVIDQTSHAAADLVVIVFVSYVSFRPLDLPPFAV